ncbi:MAG: M56 family metallopeptidase [Gemmatimonadetes bacterium]|nr:M56 family metallopeptidase [Gemmatimonadota bacterium]
MLLIILSTSPVVGHHIVGAVDWLPATLEHVGSFCLVSLHLLLAPLHTAFHWLLGVGVVVAIADRTRATVRASSILRGATITPASSSTPFLDAAAAAGLAPRQLCVLRDSPVPAFTAGWLRPRVYVAESLGGRLTSTELTAVLMHERVHADRRDPLRLSLLRFLAMVAFWMPVLRRVADDLADEAEIDADSEVAGRFPIELASALVTLAGGPNPRQSLGSVVEFQPYDLLERRVKRLTGVDAVVRTRISTRALTGAVLALLLAWSSGVMVLHPLPVGSLHATPPHCLDHATGPLGHLFCKGGVLRWKDSECPHRA